MRLPRFVVMLFVAGFTMLSSGAVSSQSPSTKSAQAYPAKPIRVVTSEIGGGSDFVARLIAQELAPSLGQQLIVDNRGGSAIILAEIVARAPPDGYTLPV